MAIESKQFDNLVAYIISDVHLNNRDSHEGTNQYQKRKIFEDFLDKILINHSADEKVLLILNGDILDLTGSWFDLPVPWDDDTEAVEKLLINVIDEIIENNIDIFKKINTLIENGNIEIIYVIGNHDGLLELYPSVQEIIKEKVLKSSSNYEKMNFVCSYENPELDLYVEHGHRLDPYNFYDSKHKPPLGDVVNVLIVNRLLGLAVTRLKEYGYSNEVIEKIKRRLFDIEYIRPLVLLPLWIDTIANEHSDLPESTDKEVSVEDVLRNIINDILLDESATKFIVKKVKVPLFLYNATVKLLIKFPSILPFISYLCTRLVKRTHSNNFQIKSAIKLSKEKGYKLICFGHTHIPTIRALSPDTYYFNTASWTPVINLFKYENYELPPEEFLNPDEHFKKLERYGIVKITKSLIEHGSKPVFSHKIVQIGES